MTLYLSTAKHPVPALVGLMGAARAGKDTVATALRDAFDYRNTSFAYSLKQAAFASLERAFPEQYARVRDEGWDVVKQEDWGRAYLQDFGTAMRDHVDKKVWVNSALDRAERIIMNTYRPVTITDVRFQNEVDAIREREGVLIRIERPGVDAVNSHVSEHEWRATEPDAVIVNDGSLDDLYRKVTETLLVLATAAANR